MLVLENILTDRGSRYAVSGGPCASEAAAKDFLKDLKRRKKFARATHNTWACLTASGQLRSDDGETLALLQSVHHEPTARRVTAERAMNGRLQGGCQVPIACYAQYRGDRLWLRGLVGRPDGSEILRAEGEAPDTDAERLGIEVAEALLAQGAGEILAEVYGD